MDTGQVVTLEVAHFSRVAATAHSRGCQPTEQGENKHVSREAAAANAISVAASRLGVSDVLFLRADARSYVLPSLRDSRVFKFKEREGIATTLEFLADASV